MRAPIRIAAAFIAAISSQCSPPNSPPVEPIGRTIYISESISAFNADSGDFVIMIMDAFDQLHIDKCNDSGGEPIYDPITNILECDGIDF